jgi:hypothetical protein
MQQQVTFDAVESAAFLFGNGCVAATTQSTPGVYEDLVQVQTAKMSKADPLAARNMLEKKWKPEGWVEDHIDRKDLDRVYESIQYAEKKITTTCHQGYPS